MPLAAFVSDLAQSEKVVAFTNDQLLRLGYESYICTDRPSKHCTHPPDIYVHTRGPAGELTGIEVKTDYYSHKSGALFFELQALNEVFSCGATYLFFYYSWNGGGVLVFNIAELLEALPTFSGPGVRYIETAGDGRAKGRKKMNPGIVVPINLLTSHPCNVTNSVIDSKWIDAWAM